MAFESKGKVKKIIEDIESAEEAYKLDALKLRNFGAAMLANTSNTPQAEIPEIDGVTFFDADLSGLTVEQFASGVNEGVGAIKIMSVTDTVADGTYVISNWEMNNPDMAGANYFGCTFGKNFTFPINPVTEPYIVNNTTPNLIKVNVQLAMFVTGGVAKFSLEFSGFSDLTSGGVGSALMDSAVFTLDSTPLDVYILAMRDPGLPDLNAGASSLNFIDLT